MPKSALQHLTLAEKSWQRQLAQAITEPGELLQILSLEDSHFPAHDRARQAFSLKVPHSYAAKMQPGNPRDPLLLQVMSHAEELRSSPGFNEDPVADLKATRVPGLLHKYPGRVLLITTGSCAVHCRYCFRRHFPYADNQPSRNQWQQALDYIRRDTSITEVILSGGDPLVLSDDRLAELIQQLDPIRHLQRLRIHSRLPVVLPARITGPLIDILGRSRLQACLVIHANHSQEIADQDIPGLRQLVSAGVCLLNQAVLLKGINDSWQSQAALSERLYAAGVLPYYLHLLDPVQGAAHFDVDDRRGAAIMKTLRQQLPGYLVPRLVREIPGKKSKTPLIGL